MFEGEKVEVQEKVEIIIFENILGLVYSVDIEVSKINWIGGKFVGNLYIGYI